MFTYEVRIKAVKLLIKYDMSYAQVIRELGYPERSTLRSWYKEYRANGDLHQKCFKKSRFTLEEKQKAVKHYLEHGKCIRRTVRAFGYPSRPTLSKWIKQFAPEEKIYCHTSGPLIRYTRKQKEAAVIALCTRTKPVRETAKEIGVAPTTLYSWKNQLLTKGWDSSMSKKDKLPQSGTNINDYKKTSKLQAEKNKLVEQVDELQKEIYKLRLERDVLEKAAEVLKKEGGISLKRLSNHEKAIVINALRTSYPLKDLLNTLNMAKSSYCYQNQVLRRGDKYSDLRQKVIDIFDDSSKRYGYRRVHAVIKSRGVTVSEKVIRYLMKEEDLLVPSFKRRKYNAYKGEISPAVPNLLQRNFHAEKPNQKWLTDITAFHIPAGKVYLSPIIDCFDGLPVSWSIGTSPDAALVNTMLDTAIATLQEGERPIVHSDRGAHYRWPGWIERMKQAHLIRSMSRKACSPDNAACEGFFGRTKNEMFYGDSWKNVSIKEFIDILDEYLRWYAEERIKISLGGMSPLAYRRSLGLVA